VRSRWRIARGRTGDKPLQGRTALRRPALPRTLQCSHEGNPVNRIIWLVGAVVIVLFILGYFGLR
jgi:hypothetical protein